MIKTKKQKVFVAMSGGVDSSTTAALLCKKRNYEVCGVFIRGWYPQGIPCTWREDRRDAMRVCALLEIPFYTFDFSREYKKHIIDYMINGYKKGGTPNPDVMCNKYIKFNAFLKKALEMGADKIATGHYVKLSGKKLKIAQDKNKDQTYFLWTLNRKQIERCLFPLGEHEKDEVRKMAKKFKLPVSDKKDSQGLCFVGEFKMKDFLKEYIKPKPGKTIDEGGETVGEHNGVQYYTIGQRHGIGAQGSKPCYVVEKDLKKNILVVSENKNEKDFLKKEIEITNVNWISGSKPDLSKKYSARIRYRQLLQKCKVQNEKSSVRIVFDKAQKAVAAGQSLVIYDGDIMLGGGIII